MREMDGLKLYATLSEHLLLFSKRFFYVLYINFNSWNCRSLCIRFYWLEQIHPATLANQ